LDSGIEAASDQFARIAAETELLKAQAALLDAKRMAAEAEQRLSGGSATQASPVLIGIYAGGTVRLAEIALGSTSRRLSQGAQVSDRWRLQAIEQGSVLLVDAQGARSRLFLNKRSGPEAVGGSIAPQAAQTPPFPAR